MAERKGPNLQNIPFPFRTPDFQEIFRARESLPKAPSLDYGAIERDIRNVQHYYAETLRDRDENPIPPTCAHCGRAKEWCEGIKKMEVRGPDGELIGVVTGWKPSTDFPGRTVVTAAVLPQFKDYLMGKHRYVSMGARTDNPSCSLCGTEGMQECHHLREYEATKEDAGENAPTFISASLDLTPEVMADKVTHLKLNRRVRDGSITSCGKRIYNRKREHDHVVVDYDHIDQVTCPRCLARKENP
jgi:hypothetical protein